MHHRDKYYHFNWTHNDDYHPQCWNSIKVINYPQIDKVSLKGREINWSLRNYIKGPKEASHWNDTKKKCKENQILSSCSISSTVLTLTHCLQPNIRLFEGLNLLILPLPPHIINKKCIIHHTKSSIPTFFLPIFFYFHKTYIDIFVSYI